MQRALVVAAVLLQQLGRCSAGTALLIIDVQDCFLENLTTTGEAGSLSVPASHIIALINDIRTSKACLFDKVVRTQDYHPANHISFGSTHGLAPFSGDLPVTCITPESGLSADGACCPTIYVNPSAVNCTEQLCPPPGWDYMVNKSEIIQDNPACTQCAANSSSCFETTQSMWTDHCLQNGDSTFPPSLIKKSDDLVVQKGTNQYVDAYSAFMDNTQTMKTVLDAELKAANIDTLYVVGIATDVCVRWTVGDAIPLGYTINVVSDATAAVGGNQEKFDSAIAAMVKDGAKSMTVADVLALECPTPSPPPELPSSGAARDLLNIALLSGAMVLAF